MVEVDGSGNNIRAAAEWLARLAPNGNRLEWTAAFELVGTAGFGHDNIFLLSDRSPTLSVERILDEVRHLEVSSAFLCCRGEGGDVSVWWDC